MRIYTCLVGDLFHYGHVNFLRQAKELGNYLLVGICSDEDCVKYKRNPIMSFFERVAVIESCKYVDEIIQSPPSIVKNDFINHYKIDIVVHGDDSNVNQLNYFYKDAIDRNIYKSIPYTKGINTSDIIKRITDRNKEDLDKKKFFFSD
jgi:glycerol-3-phosphate cytidylyltransferase